MRWDHPEFLFALWLLLPLALLLRFALKRRAKAARRFLDDPMAARLLPLRAPGRGLASAVLVLAGFAFLILAAARPRWGMYFQQVRERGTDVMVLLDVSRSMLSQDVKPSRLERAKSDVRDLLDRVGGDRVGLIAFAGKAVLACPLTTDHGYYKAALEDVGPTTAPRGGTAIGDAIREALRRMERLGDRDQSLLLITDGEDHESFPREAAALAAERDIRIFTVGMGDIHEGARIPVVDEHGNRGFLKHEGKQVWSKLDEGLLEEIALKTGGAYVPARTRDYDLGEVYESHLQTLTAGDAAIDKRKRYRERFQLFLAFGLGCLVIELLMKRYRQRPRVAGVAAALVLLALASPASADPIEDVRKGVRAFENGEFEKANEHFDAAGKNRPDTPEIAFDKAIALQRLGRHDDARAEYLEAAGTRDSALAARARYNLGTLATEEAQAVFGEKPEDAHGETREKGVEALERAIRDYRACLEIAPEHADARHNVELLLLWLKQMRSVWAEKDKQREQDKKDEEKEEDLAAFLKKLVDRQGELRVTTHGLGESPAAEATKAVAEGQEALAEQARELPDRIDKMVAKQAQAMQAQPAAGGGAPAAQADEMKKAADAMKLMAAQAQAALDAVAPALRANDARLAAENQANARAILESLWTALAPFQQVVQSAEKIETSIVDALLDPPATPVLEAEDQVRVVLTALAFPQKIAQAKQQAQMMAATPQQGGGGPGGGQAAQEQAEALQKALAKAEELTPEIQETASEATETLLAGKVDEAKPKAERVRDLLREILKLFPKDPNQQQQKQQNKNDQDQKKDEQQKQDPKQKQDQKDQQKGKMQRPDEVESMLRKAEEREREQKEREKRRARLAAGAGTVERDW
ncbi:MAG: VWA domain-containing protein [Planctomycetota bacterium]